MRTLIIALLTLTSTLLFAQNTATWIGGTPGAASKWNEPGNWNNNEIPDEETYVIIKQLNTGHNAQPVVDSYVEVVAIEIQAGAYLTITEQGELVLDGEYIYSEGISLFGGKLINKGIINFFNLAVDISEKALNKIQNSGHVFVDNKLRDAKSEASKMVQRY